MTWLGWVPLGLSRPGLEPSSRVRWHGRTGRSFVISGGLLRKPKFGFLKSQKSPLTSSSRCWERFRIWSMKLGRGCKYQGWSFARKYAIRIWRLRLRSRSTWLARTANLKRTAQGIPVPSTLDTSESHSYRCRWGSAILSKHRFSVGKTYLNCLIKNLKGEKFGGHILRIH